MHQSFDRTRAPSCAYRQPLRVTQALGLSISCATRRAVTDPIHHQKRNG
jgi:hypothetical protein